MGSKGTVDACSYLKIVPIKNALFLARIIPKWLQSGGDFIQHLGGALKAS